MSGDAAVAVELDVLHAGEIAMPHWYAFRPRGDPVARALGLLRPEGPVLRAPCLAFAVRHPVHGAILVDTGLHPDVSRSVREDFGVLMGVLFRSLRADERPFAEQLRALGIEPADVGTVVMTHLHVDHTSGMRLLPAAEFVCAREEWAAAHGRLAARDGYAGSHLPPESRMRLVDFGRDGEPHGPFARTIDLLGDGSVRLVSTPGHTRGHLSVLLRVAGGGEVLLVGDAAYTTRSIDEQLLPLITADDDASRRSLRELARYAHEHPGAVVVPSHDPTAWHALRVGERPSGRGSAAGLSRGAR